MAASVSVATVWSAHRLIFIEIGVKRQPHGKVSNWMHDNLSVGDVIELGDVGGDFVLPATLPSKMLLIAGGSGVTPIYSILVEALKRQANLDVTVMYYANTDKDLAFGNEMVELAVKHPSLKLHYALASAGDAGRFSTQQLSAGAQIILTVPLISVALKV